MLLLAPGAHAQAHTPNPGCPPVAIYSWHIVGPGGPEPVLWGATALFLPASTGSYTIELWQDNLGLLVETRGTRRVALSDVPPATEACVPPKVARQGRRTARRAAPAIP